MVPVPDEADEDARRCIRERTELISERVGLTNRIGAVLATLGVRMPRSRVCLLGGSEQ
jgi:transposase